jgi:nicotinamide riboside kinase
MRITISGTQSTGKTTLANDLAEVVPNARVEPEPFRVLQKRLGLVSGLESMTPGQELELILHNQRRLQALRAGETVFYDRCALDALAHALVARDGGNGAFSTEWIERLRTETNIAMQSVDLVIVVSLEEGMSLEADGVRSTDAAYRVAVDEVIERLASTEKNTLFVQGDRTERVRRVLHSLEEEHGMSFTSTGSP